MLIEENEKMVSVHFDSILDLIEGDFSDKVESKKIERYLSDREVGSREYGRTNKTYKDVINHALIGDSVLLEQLEDKIRILDKVTGKNTIDYEQKIQKSRRRRTFGDEGDELDIEKVYNGDLDTCWTRTEKIEFDTTHKFVTLFIENGAAWNENVTSSFWRAAVAVFLTRELERAGKSVKIVVGSCARGALKTSNKKLAQSMTVKEYNQHVSLERVAAMTHLGFFRTVSFALFHMSDYTVCGNIGSPDWINNGNWPIQLQKQADKGHTRLIHIKPATSQTSAIDALKSAYEQLLAASDL